MSNPSEEVMKLAREIVHNLSAFDEKVNADIIARAIMADRVSCQARIEELERGMRRLMLAYVNLMETGRGRIVSLGGTCDPVDVMEAGDPWLRAARSTLEGK